MQFYFSLTTTSLFQTYPFTIFIIYFNITYSPIALMLPITKNAIYNVKPMLRNSFFAQKLSTQSSSFKINIVFPLKTNINTALITNTIEQNRCAMACQGCGAVLFLLKSSGITFHNPLLLSYHTKQLN